MLLIDEKRGCEKRVSSAQIHFLLFLRDNSPAYEISTKLQNTGLLIYILLNHESAYVYPLTNRIIIREKTCLNADTEPSV